jgi:hypothetical protein
MNGDIEMKLIERIEPYFSGRFWFLYKFLDRFDALLHRCFFKYDFLNRLAVIAFLMAIFVCFLLSLLILRQLNS